MMVYKNFTAKSAEGAEKEWDYFCIPQNSLIFVQHNTLRALRVLRGKKFLIGGLR